MNNIQNQLTNALKEIEYLKKRIKRLVLGLKHYETIANRHPEGTFNYEKGNLARQMLKEKYKNDNPQ